MEKILIIIKIMTIIALIINVYLWARVNREIKKRNKLESQIKVQNEADFKTGDKIVVVAKLRPWYFNDSGAMDYMLDRKAVLTVKSVHLNYGNPKKSTVYVTCSKTTTTRILEFKDIELLARSNYA